MVMLPVCYGGIFGSSRECCFTAATLRTLVYRQCVCALVASHKLVHTCFSAVRLHPTVSTHRFGSHNPCFSAGHRPLATLLVMRVDVFTLVSAFWFGEGYLDFSALCKLGFTSQYLHAEFEKIVHVHINVCLNRLLTFTLPENTRSVHLSFSKNKVMTARVLEWWLHAILATAGLHKSELSCGTITALYWTVLCRSIYRFIKEWRCDLFVPLHISVDGFRQHHQAPCRSPDELPWVAEMAHLVLHASSRVTICSPYFEITKDWVLSQLFGGARGATSSEDAAVFPWLAEFPEEL